MHVGEDGGSRTKTQSLNNNSKNNNVNNSNKITTIIIIIVPFILREHLVEN